MDVKSYEEAFKKLEQIVAELEKEEILMQIYLGRGAVEEVLWTCDLSFDYVRINAEYRT